MATDYGSYVSNTVSGSTRKWRAYMTYSISNSETQTVLTISAMGMDLDGGSGTTMKCTENHTHYSLTSSVTPSSPTTLPSKSSGYPSSDKTVNGSDDWKMVSTTTLKWPRGTTTTASTVKWKVTQTSASSWSGTSTASISVGIPLKNKYTVTFNGNGGNTTTVTDFYGTSKTAPTSTRTGHTFKGWATSASASSASLAGGGAYTITGTATYYAVWVANTYTLTAYANGGSISATSGWDGSGSSATKKVGYNDFYNTLPTVSRSYYTLTGWTDASSGGNTKTSSSLMPASAASIYAQWRGNDYTITLNNQSATSAGSTAVYTRYSTGIYTNSTRTTVMSTSQNPITIPSKTGYTFKGYYTGTGGTGTQMISATGYVTTSFSTTYYTAAGTLYAYWTINSYTLTAYGNGGSISSTSGWSGTGNSATKSLQYTAAYGTLPTVSRNYYTLKGWYNANSGGSTVDITTPIGAENTSIFAQWNPINYTISYTLNGGTLSNAITTYNVETSSFTLGTPTKTGYTFTGWTGSNGSTPQTSVTIATGSTGNKTYTANWTPTSYSITYELNGGNITNPPRSYTIESTQFSLVSPTKTGHTFAGWTGSNGNTPQTSVTIVQGSTGNQTYVANWTVNTYTLTAYSNGGTITTSTGWNGSGNSATKSLQYNTAYGTFPTVSWVNHSLKGWYNASTNGSAVSTTTTIGAGDTSIYAQWFGDKTGPSFAQQFHVQRCNANGQPEPSGDFCLVTFRVNPGKTYSDTSSTLTNGPTKVEITYKARGSLDSPTAVGNTINNITTDNSLVNIVVEDQSHIKKSFHIQTLFDFSVTLTNLSNGKTATASDFLSAAYFPMDFNADATALGIFRVAPDDAEGLYVAKTAYFEEGAEGIVEIVRW